MTDAIVTRRLTKHYGNRPVVNALDLRVPQGSVYGLLGRNGAGKSTAIKMLMGMVQPDYGEIEILGHPMPALPCEVRQRVAYIAEGHPLYNWMTVDEAVRFTKAFYPRWNDRLLAQILDHFELPGRAKLRKLSNGQRAQASLALAVAPDPELLVLDDPTLGLDTVVRRDFLESLIQIIQRSGRTILFSSHILGDVERVADRVGVMVDGVLRADCPTEHFRETVKRVVLEFRGRPADWPGGGGVVSWRHVGSALELVTAGFDDAQRALAESLQPASIDVIDLSLEDAFIEYTRGPKRSLPLFVEERADDSRASHQGAA
jgi:ABC-2 type transport system ATP-binding protein